MSSTYFPKDELSQSEWYSNFAVKAPAYATALGITAAEITYIQNGASMFKYCIDGVMIGTTDLKRRVAFKAALTNGSIGSVIGAFPLPTSMPTAPATVTGGLFHFTSKLVKRIKSNVNYTVTIGVDLGLEKGPEMTLSAAAIEIAPVLRVSNEAGNVILKWKKGKFKLIDIWVNRNDGKGFVHLATSGSTQFTDDFELPENENSRLCIYKARYRVGDVPSGNYSAEVRGTISRQLDQ